MLLSEFLEIGKWAAALFLSAGYWIQVYKIHLHKEVRDLSMISYILFAFSYLLLGLEGYSISSKIFTFKNILVIIPTMVIIFQIRAHRRDKWQD